MLQNPENLLFPEQLIQRFRDRYGSGPNHIAEKLPWIRLKNYLTQSEPGFALQK